MLNCLFEMRKLFISLSGIVIILLTFAACRNENKSVNQNKPYQLVWDDEFEYTGFPDSTKWSYDTAGNDTGWGNKELEYYTRERKENAWVDSGSLTIRAIKDNSNGHAYSSARLRTSHKGDWLYGKIEVRARLPKGIGCWPAIWMLPTDWEYGGWPESGEIDIMEMVGYNPDTVYSSVHTQAYNHKIGTQKTKGIYVADPSGKFHIYGMEWQPDTISFFLDHKKFFSFINEKKGFKEWPFDKQFHLLLNIAVGGTWGGAEGVDDSSLPYEMKVDYVRVYQR